MPTLRSAAAALAALALALPAAAQRPTVPARPAPSPAPAAPRPATAPSPAPRPEAWTLDVAAPDVWRLDTDLATTVSAALLDARAALADLPLRDAVDVALTGALAWGPADVAIADLAIADLAGAWPSVATTLAEAPFADGRFADGPFAGVAGAWEAPALRSTAPAPWAQDDPADSLYRLAREALNRGDYRRAATLFQDLSARFARSAYAADAAYWEAFARYRLRTGPELRRALDVLEAHLARGVTSATTADARVLATRIRGELASTTVGGATPVALSRQLQQTARAGDGCDREAAAVRIEALGALAKIDSAAVVPTARRVLADQAPCAASLRERAVLILSRGDSPAAVDLLASAARTDSSMAVRAAALAGLARVGGDRGVAILEEALRTAADDRTASAAAGALARSDHPRARAALRATAERGDAPVRVRAYAIGEMARDTTAATGAWLRALYPRLDSTRLRETALAAGARQPGPEMAAWLAGVARDEAEPMRVRRAALAAYARRDVAIADLARLYDATTEPELRDALVGTFARRREPEATDKLLAIARSDASSRLRRAAIAALTRKDDPRTTRLLMEIIDRP